MVEPTFMDTEDSATVIPSTARADNRASEAYARSIFEWLYPDLSTRRGCSRLLTSAILFANQQSSSCWGVTLFSNRVRLNVGQMEVVVLRPSEVYLVLAEPGIPESVREQIASYLFFPLGAYPSVPGEKALCRVPPSRIERIYPLVEAAHQALVQRAAERKRTTPFQASFSPGVIQYLRTLLGAWLPLPSYFAQIGYEAGLFPDEVREEDIFREGAVRHVSVNAYERDSRARQRCIEFYGTSCIVCGLNFEELYGEVGTSFIHVHHLRPLGEIGAEYEVDPRNDLRPVCPNCHAMIHRRVPAFSIEEVKAFLNESRVPSEIMRRRRT